MQTLKVTVEIEVTDTAGNETTQTVNIEKQVPSPATQDDIDNQLIEIERQHDGNMFSMQWNEEELN